MGSWRALVEISRPSQWVFLLLPFLLAATAGMTRLQSFVRPDFLILVLFFLFPANFLLNGLQLWFSPKAAARSRILYKESAPPDLNLLRLGQGILIVGLLFGLLLLVLAPGPGFVLFLWLIMVLLFVAPPFRLGERRFSDIYISFLFVLPAVVGWWWATLEPPTFSTTLSWGFLAAGWRLLQLIAEYSAQGDKKRIGSVALFDESQALFVVFVHTLLFAWLAQDGSWLSRLAYIVPALSAFFLLLPKKSIRIWYPVVLMTISLLAVLVFSIFLLRLIL